MELPTDYSPIQLKVVGNTSEEALIANIQHAMSLDLPWIKQEAAHTGQAIIVGGGPSLLDCIEEIRLRSSYCKIFALNNTWKILRQHGIEPDYHVMLDARPENKAFVLEGAAKRYYASLCHPDIKADVLWHPVIDGIMDFVGDHHSGETLVGGGTSVGTRAICLAYLLGFRNIHLYGLDSSYRDGSHHAYAQPLNDNERVIEVWLAGKKFTCAAWMATQAEEFRDLMPQLMELGCVITVHGDGLIPYMAEQLNNPVTVLTAVYDLACSPPTYDFLSFLCAAEQARLNGGYSYIDVVFQPGPKDGFRDDNLPPDSKTRKDMLWHICVPACRLLASVRGVSVLGERTPIEGAVFPQGWAVDNPVHRYGVGLVKSVPHALTSQVKLKERPPYVTITIRECDYWPERNSNIPEWMKVADEIERMGYDVIWIDDTKVSTSVYSWDIEKRMALYQGAACNLMVSNGPADLVKLSSAPYLIFKPVTESCPSTTLAFLEANGIREGDQFGDNGCVIWEADTAEIIIKHFKNFPNISDLNKVQSLTKEQAWI